ncbi:hypothetical protein FGO68_gene11724 [Halteria grandinella]|uniref:Uncharacterized protein n=1 Tax=Halteria grandinella TaxID=5974 RepID=A0A8J8NB36_HALGN|nr:hypothetical protein FGO68_gene11724 [Halteria grandinella]
MEVCCIKTQGAIIEFLRRVMPPHKRQVSHICLICTKIPRLIYNPSSIIRVRSFASRIIWSHVDHVVGIKELNTTPVVRKLVRKIACSHHGWQSSQMKVRIHQGWHQPISPLPAWH